LLHPEPKFKQKLTDDVPGGAGLLLKHCRERIIMKNILIIDDDEGVRTSFLAALEYGDYHPYAVASGEAGVESAERQPPDLIFLDLKMTGLDGVQTLGRLRALHPGVPIYVVTGFAGEFLEPLRALRHKGTSFELARKPLTVSEIRAIADGVLGASQH
jgi:CheY-like chemotaxis protein